jgi:hypothetical protein
MNVYKTLTNELGYSSAATKNEEGVNDVENDEVYVISPDVYGDMDGYDTENLTYYADKVLAYDDGEIVKNVDELIREESLTHFGEFEDDSVFVRNEKLKTDYEILLDVRKYSEVSHLIDED